MFVSADSIRAPPFGVIRIHIRFPRVARRSFPSRRSTLGCHRAAPIGAILTRAHEGQRTSNDSALDFRLRVLVIVRIALYVNTAQKFGPASLVAALPRCQVPLT